MVSRVIRLGFFAFALCTIIVAPLPHWQSNAAAREKVLFLLAPGCSINPDTPEALLRAAGSGIRSAPVV